MGPERPAFQPQGAVAQAGQFLVVSDDDSGQSLFSLQLPDQSMNLISRALIQISGRLVGQEQRWRINQRPGQSDPLPLAPRKLAGTMVGAPGQPDTTEQNVGPTGGDAFRRAADQSRHHHVLCRRGLTEQVLKLTTHSNAPRAKDASV